ncbi:Nlrc3 [Symbiodinium sp. CCMP2592]|nr:Nlrc3 [Symbiodinium sp. CCMP2592]
MQPSCSCCEPLRWFICPPRPKPHSTNEAEYNLEDPQSLAAFLKYADIRLVRAGYLYDLRRKKRLLPRRQEAAEWGLVSHTEVSKWATGRRDAMIISISHAWETREHPDPCGDQLNRLVDRLCLYDAAYYSDIWVFYDYISLFQFERRTSAEEESFRRSMNHMHVLYAHDYSWTFRIEALTPRDVWDATLANAEHLVTVYDAASKTVRGRPLKELVPNRVPYQSRGWCKAEVEWSSCRSRSEQNRQIDAPDPDSGFESDVLQGKVPMAPEVFEEGMAKAEFTHRNDAAAVLQLQRKIFHQKVSECEELLLADLPKGELGQLAKALIHYKKLRVLRLRNIEVGEEEAKEFAKALTLNTTTTELEIQVSHSAQAECKALWKALADMLKANATVSTLNLGFNGIGAESLEALAAAVATNGTLTTIDLRGNDIGSEGCKALGQALKTNDTLTTIDLRQNIILAGGLKAIAEALTTNRALTTINLDYNGSGHEFLWEIQETLKTRKAFTKPNLAATIATQVSGFLAYLGVQEFGRPQQAQAWTGKVRIEALTSRLKSNTSSIITSLKIADRQIGFEDVKALADGLKTNRTITRIDLRRNHIGARGCEALAEVFVTNDTIATIDLEGNDIQDQGCKALAEALKSNAAITAIDLEGNGITDLGLKALAEALKINRTITKIDLSRNQIRNQGCEALAEALKSNAAIADLNLGRNRIGDDGIKALAEAWKINRTTIKIDLWNNPFGDESREAMREMSTNFDTIDFDNRWIMETRPEEDYWPGYWPDGPQGFHDYSL